MLKRVLAVAAALIVGTFAFAQTTADGGATPAAAGSVNASWGNWKSIPKSKIGTDMFSYKKPVEIAANGTAKGAKFQLENGEVKFKTESYTALYHNNKDSSTIETLSNPKQRKAEYSITIDDAATITVTVAGNGSKAKSRCVVLAQDGATPEAAPTIFLSVDNLSQDEAPVTLTFKNAPKGTYKLWGNGHRIVAVEAKN